MKMNPEWLPAFTVGFVIGMFTIGVAMTHIGPNSVAKVDSRKAECELNIPRNQSCVMQFVPETPAKLPGS
jgi:hypothetical protein